MSNQNITLDLLPGMVFFQKHQRLHLMLTTITKTDLTFSKIHDTRGVVSKTIPEFYALLHEEKWIQLSLQECISLANIKAKSTGEKIKTAAKKVEDLKELEKYYFDLKGIGERYNNNLSRQRK